MWVICPPFVSRFRVHVNFSLTDLLYMINDTTSNVQVSAFIYPTSSA